MTAKQIVLCSGARLGVLDPRVKSLSDKGMAAAFLATASALYTESEGNWENAVNTSLYKGALWIKRCLSERRVELSAEINELESERVTEVDAQFLDMLLNAA